MTGTGHLADESLPPIDESLPPIPGLDGFTSQVFHSARRNDEVPLEGKRVGIVGSGATAIQVIPELTEIASEPVVFQRSAPYAIPRRDRAYSEIEKRTFRRDPESMATHRSEIFWMLENSYAQRRAVPQHLAQAKALAGKRLANQDEALRAKLAPNYHNSIVYVIEAQIDYILGRSSGARPMATTSSTCPSRLRRGTGTNSTSAARAPSGPATTARAGTSKNAAAA